MKSRFLVSSLALVVLSLAAAPAVTAQPREGEPVVAAYGSYSGLYYVTRTSVMRRLIQIGNWPLNSVHVALGNRGVIANQYGSPYQVLMISPTGKAYSIVRLKTSYMPSAIATDQDSNYVFASENMLMRLHGAQQTTLAMGPGMKWNGICRDMETGDFVVGDYRSGKLMFVERRSGKITTFSTSVGTNCLTGVAYVPESHAFAVTRLYHQNGLALVNRAGTIIKTSPIANASAVAVDEKYGTIYVVTTDGRVHAFDSWGNSKWFKDFGDHLFSGVDVWGNKAVSAVGSGQAGTEHQVGLRFNHSLGKTYAAAVAFGYHPPIKVPGPREINLRADLLFWNSVARDIPGYTQGFIGTLNSSTGYALAKFKIPKEVPAGVRVYFTAVALNTSFPGNLDIANTAVIKVWTK